MKIKNNRIHQNNYREIKGFQLRIKIVLIRKKTPPHHFKNLKITSFKSLNVIMKEVLKVLIFYSKYSITILNIKVKIIFNLQNLIISMEKSLRKVTKYTFQKKNFVDLENLSLLILK